jgi:hypothetical protein
MVVIGESIDVNILIFELGFLYIWNFFFCGF